ncbi:hypothetical protein Bbelb_407080 [Branchiostoma belcheri]|nr:hypothetical protein Bbelb_407080 [Branchiostoma belcheri]
MAYMRWYGTGEKDGETGLWTVEMDFSRAFDTIDHGKLLCSLVRMGVRRSLRSCISSYLSDRKQRVKWGGSVSESRPVLSGTPLGGIVSPALFAIAMNCLDETSTRVIPVKYADDLTNSECLMGSLPGLMQTSMTAVLSWATSPVVEYGSPVWGGLSTTLSNELEKIQKLCCKIIGTEHQQLHTLEFRRHEASLRELQRILKDTTHPCRLFLPPVHDANQKAVADAINKYLASISQQTSPVSTCQLPAYLPASSPPPQIQPWDMYRELSNIRVRKAGGPGGIAPRIVKMFACELSEPLTDIFNTSLREGVVPSAWKEAVVAPLPKDLPATVDKLRPISLTSIFAKICEGFVAKWTMSDIWANIDLRQFGGIKRSSTTHCLVSLIHFLHKGAGTSENMGTVVLTDFSKAFDTINHLQTISKLLSMGTRPSIVPWIVSFLVGRRQRVRYGSTLSEWENLRTLQQCGLETLENRRVNLCRKFAVSMEKSERTADLLPPTRGQSTRRELRNSTKRTLPITRCPSKGRDVVCVSSWRALISALTYLEGKAGEQPCSQLASFRATLNEAKAYGHHPLLDRMVLRALRPKEDEDIAKKFAAVAAHPLGPRFNPLGQARSVDFAKITGLCCSCNQPGHFQAKCPLGRGGPIRRAPAAVGRGGGRGSTLGVTLSEDVCADTLLREYLRKARSMKKVDKSCTDGDKLLMNDEGVWLQYLLDTRRPFTMIAFKEWNSLPWSRQHVYYDEFYTDSPEKKGTLCSNFNVIGALTAKKGRQDTVPQPQPLQDTVPQPQPLQDTVPQPQPLQDTVPQPQPLQDTVPTASTTAGHCPTASTTAGHCPHSLNHCRTLSHSLNHCRTLSTRDGMRHKRWHDENYEASPATWRPMLQSLRSAPDVTGRLRASCPRGRNDNLCGVQSEHRMTLNQQSYTIMGGIRAKPGHVTSIVNEWGKMYELDDMECDFWVHKKCCGIRGSLSAVRNYVYPRCRGEARPLDARPVTQVTVDEAVLDVEPSFCYLGDMLCGRWLCCVAWGKFKKLLRILQAPIPENPWQGVQLLCTIGHAAWEHVKRASGCINTIVDLQLPGNRGRGRPSTRQPQKNVGLKVLNTLGVNSSIQPPKTEDRDNECTQHQRKHVDLAKGHRFGKKADACRNHALLISMDDKAYLRPGASEDVSRSMEDDVHGQGSCWQEGGQASPVPDCPQHPPAAPVRTGQRIRSVRERESQCNFWTNGEKMKDSMQAYKRHPNQPNGAGSQHRQKLPEPRRMGCFGRLPGPVLLDTEYQPVVGTDEEQGMRKAVLAAAHAAAQLLSATDPGKTNPNPGCSKKRPPPSNEPDTREASTSEGPKHL